MGSRADPARAPARGAGRVAVGVAVVTTRGCRSAPRRSSGRNSSTAVCTDSGLGSDIDRATALSALATYCLFFSAGICPRSALPVMSSAPAPSSA